MKSYIDNNFESDIAAESSVYRYWGAVPTAQTLTLCNTMFYVFRLRVAVVVFRAY